MSYLGNNTPVSPAAPFLDEYLGLQPPEYQAAVSNMRATPTSTPQESTFRTTPLPDVSSSSVKIRKRKPARTTLDIISDDGDKLNAILLAIRTIDNNIQTELTAVKTEVAALNSRLDELQKGISNQTDETRSCTRVVQKDIASGVGYIADKLSGHRERIQRAADLIKEITNN